MELLSKVEILSELSVQELELKEVESQLTSLTLRRKSLRDSILNLRAKVAPISFVPPDILSEIFARCLPGPGEFPTMSPSKPPLILGRVCRSWREISRATPELWDSLNIMISTYPDDNDSALALKETAIREWFSRAGARGLSIGLTSFAVGPPYDMTSSRTHHIARILRVVSEFAGSWKRFCTTIHWWEMIQALDGTAEPGADHSSADQGNVIEILLSQSSVLEEVQFRIRNLYYTPPLAEYGQVRHRITFPSSLRRLTVEGAPINDLALYTDWASLTHLRLSDRRIPSIAVLQVLSRCRDLVYCSISISHDESAIPDSYIFGLDASTTSKSLILPHLRTLEADIYSINKADDFLARLSLPSIQHITYVLHHDPLYTPPIQEIPGTSDPPSILLKHSTLALPVRSLSLWGGPEGIGLDSLVIGYLESCTNLRQLRIGILDGALLARLMPHILLTDVEYLVVNFSTVNWASLHNGLPTSFKPSDITNLLGNAFQEYSRSASGKPRLKNLLVNMEVHMSGMELEQLEQYAKSLESESGLKCIFENPAYSPPPPPPDVRKPEFWGYRDGL